jgi:hypothetical protein
VAKPLRLAFVACIIQAEYGYSDVETDIQIQRGVLVMIVPEIRIWSILRTPHSRLSLHATKL